MFSKTTNTTRLPIADSLFKQCKQLSLVAWLDGLRHFNRNQPSWCQLVELQLHLPQHVVKEECANEVRREVVWKNLRAPRGDPREKWLLRDGPLLFDSERGGTR